MDGRPVNNVDVSNALRQFPIAQFALHQAADGALRFKVREPGVADEQIRAALLALFGEGQRLSIEAVDALGDKVIQYTSDGSTGDTQNG
jgi:phenylacetate-CoA ligase